MEILINNLLDGPFYCLRIINKKLRKLLESEKEVEKGDNKVDSLDQLYQFIAAGEE